MHYDNIIKGRFIKRPNRFIAHVVAEGKEQVCHVRNTGRMGELLIPDIGVYLQKDDNPKRKTHLSLISFETEQGIINVDSLAPNKLFLEYNPLGFEKILPEKKYKDSRFDFYVEKGGKSGFCEVKGVTLLGEENIALFPDAPTERGIKHIHHLIDLKKEGALAVLAFIVKIPNIKVFMPNPNDKAFCHALKEAKRAGVEIHAFGCKVGASDIEIDGEIEVEFEAEIF